MKITYKQAIVLRAIFNINFFGGVATLQKISEEIGDKNRGTTQRKVDVLRKKGLINSDNGYKIIYKGRLLVKKCYYEEFFLNTNA